MHAAGFRLGPVGGMAAGEHCSACRHRRGKELVLPASRSTSRRCVGASASASPSNPHTVSVVMHSAGSGKAACGTVHRTFGESRDRSGTVR